MNDLYNKFCGKLSTSWYDQWNSSSPDIPLCFQFFDYPIYLTMYSILCILYIIWLKTTPLCNRPIQKLCCAKIALICSLVLLQIVELIYSIVKANVIPIPFYISNCCFLITLVIMLTIIIFEKRHDGMNSGFYFNYWVFYFSMCIVRSRTAALSFRYKTDELTNVQCVLIYLNLICVSCSLLLSSFSDKKIVNESAKPISKKSKLLKVDADGNDYSVNLEMQNGTIAKEKDDWNNNKKLELRKCPEIYASFISRISFYWFTPLVIKGYRRPLTNKDLWLLNDEDYSRSIVPTMVHHLNKYLVVDDGDSNSVKDTDQTNTNVNSVNQTGTAEVPEPTDTDPTKKALLNDNEKEKPQEKFDYSLVHALLRAHWSELLLSGFFKLVHDSLIFLGPILLKLLLDFVSNGSDYIWKGYFFALLLLITAVIRSFFLHQYFHLVFRLGMRIRSSIVSIVYRKSLVLSTMSRKDSTVGEIVNLMSVDAQKFLELTNYIHILWSGPFQIIVAMIFLWRELGPSVLAGVAVMLLLIPVNGVIGNITRKLQTEQLKVSDHRIKLMNEILNGIKVLKLYAWEPSFIKFISDIRNKELGFMRRSAYLNAAISFTFNCAPFIVSLTSFGMFVIVSSSNILTAEKAFVSISLFNILRFPLLMLPMVISNLIQASVSLKRLTKFLKRAEIDKNAVQHDNKPGMAASIDNGNFCWNHAAKVPFLTNIQMSVPQGHLIAIVGPVGSGKSSILSALLGEIHKLNGSVNLNGSVAYVPQQAWIVNATVRDNIVFGLPFDPCKYNKILNSCCLVRDLEILKDSDNTEIGEKGINLSGGQKQRISLARACYSDADVILLDDPLSAVDSHVGKDLIDNVLGPNGLLAGRSRILVTHNLTVLPFCDKVFVLENGQITEEGSYCQLIKHAGAFSKFVATHMSEELQKTNCNNVSAEDLAEKEQILLEIQEKLAENNESNSALFTSLSKSREKLRQSRESLNNGQIFNEMEVFLDEDKKKLKQQECLDELKKMGIEKNSKNTDKLIEEEKSKEGNVRMAVYMAYFKSVGIWVSLLIFVLFIITQCFGLGSNLWLVRWSAQSAKVSNFTKILQELEKATVPEKDEISQIKKYLNHERDVNLGVYGLLGLGQALIQLFGSAVFAYGTVRACDGLHRHLLQGVLRYPMSTFDSIPIGRIINRFSSDLYSIAAMLPMAINALLVTILSSMMVFVMITLPNPWIILPLSLMILFYALMQRFYVATSRQLKRLESVSKSPIYSHFGETLQGVSSIRAYGLCDKFIESSEEKVDSNLYAYYANIVSNRWLAVILEFIGNLIVFLAAVFSVVSLHMKLKIDAGLVGLSVSYALSITQTLNWLVRMSSEVESNIVSVERIEEYSNMEPEAKWEIEEKKPGSDWPQGAIAFNNYSTRYREGLDLVLDDISFNVSVGEKIGIVGRTGSGKSSLVLALFRILEGSGGEILIDGVPIKDLGLHDIRGRLTIIPQDPVLFSGTLRRNLDPFTKHTDDDIWKVLELSHLKQFVTNSGTEQLEMSISEGGENLSVGQRQLVCLARALLRRTNILVLDEATAAVDLDTDDLIQRTIRSEFKSCTILTIAHRLNTVLDYDKILVLEQGKIVEMGSPTDLLANNDSHFYSMAKSANLV